MNAADGRVSAESLWDAEGREELLSALADHFLDTETRHLSPLTAWTCLRLGWSLEHAGQLWFRGVVPALAGASLAVAGPWAGWDQEELEQRVRQALAQPVWKQRWLAWLPHRRAARGQWDCIVACYQHLQGSEEPESIRKALLEGARVILNQARSDVHEPGVTWDPVPDPVLLELFQPALSPREVDLGRLRLLGWRKEHPDLGWAPDLGKNRG